MRRPELLLLTACAPLLLAACAKSPMTIKPPKVKGAEEIAQPYRLQDGEQTRRRVQVRDLLGLASQRLALGEGVEAGKLAGKALKLDPQSTGALTLLAVSEELAGNAGEAGAYYRRAAELAPHQGELLNNYGAWLCGNGHPAEALVWFERALALPGHARIESTLANAGDCALRAGQMEAASGYLRGALALAPTHALALASMAQLQFDQGQYLSARAFSERRLAAAPADASVLQLAVKIESRLGDGVAASRYQQRLRDEFPGAVTADSGEDRQ
jgi:type IV pilus assembly protein PilF